MNINNCWIEDGEDVESINYKPSLAQSCCQAYALRVVASEFQQRLTHEKVLKRIKKIKPVLSDSRNIPLQQQQAEKAQMMHLQILSSSKFKLIWIQVNQGSYQKLVNIMHLKVYYIRKKSISNILKMFRKQFVQNQIIIDEFNFYF
ncbi:unnamed protein product [Paramecium sonneborni]|uniref:Uncharacterized protein n=1 Tax=Paramecium sonneborni TaxID=65129 RepID=A0A8S1RRH4_9CILI|nr:unnamed protein product [Paramecium sonneborni]